MISCWFNNISKRFLCALSRKVQFLSIQVNLIQNTSVVIPNLYAHKESLKFIYDRRVFYIRIKTYKYCWSETFLAYVRLATIPIEYKCGLRLQHVLQRKINFLIFIFWVNADCIYNLPKIYRPKKKNYSKVAKFTGKMRIAQKMIFEFLSSSKSISLSVRTIKILLTVLCNRLYNS